MQMLEVHRITLQFGCGLRKQFPKKVSQGGFRPPCEREFVSREREGQAPDLCMPPEPMARERARKRPVRAGAAKPQPPTGKVLDGGDSPSPLYFRNVLKYTTWRLGGHPKCANCKDGSGLNHITGEERFSGSGSDQEKGNRGRRSERGVPSGGFGLVLLVETGMLRRSRRQCRCSWMSVNEGRCAGGATPLVLALGLQQHPGRGSTRATRGLTTTRPSACRAPAPRGAMGGQRWW